MPVGDLEAVVGITFGRALFDSSAPEFIPTPDAGRMCRNAVARYGVIGPVRCLFDFCGYAL